MSIRVSPYDLAMETPTSDDLIVEQHDRVAVITLNRPDRRNALTHAMVAELTTVLERLDGDDGTRAVIVTGSGPGFCAGADLGGGPSDAEQTIRRLYTPLILAMTRMSTPLIAAVNGIAAGAGCSLALACDTRIAGSSAAFQLSFTRIGLVPDAGATWLLPRIVGAARASEMALLGRKIGTDDALRWNLVNEVVPADALLARAREVAVEMSTLAASSVAATKRLLHDSFERDLAGQLDAEATAQGLAQHSEDFQRTREQFRRRAQERSAVQP